ncbi:S26 family signal peptidase [Planctomycetes bacterium K23_9]|uniref:S26 family signal peptidase n=1 Tax=Stieleria marina TaxID=1930275 RepID=UPI0011A48273
MEPHFDQLLARHQICGICGGPLHRTDEVAGDIVEIVALDETQKATLQIGDVVAIEYNSKLRAKRIAALPGDTISIRDERIFINDQRLEDAIATTRAPFPTRPKRLIVDEDNRHEISRWQPKQKNTFWKRDSHSHWSYEPSNLVGSTSDNSGSDNVVPDADAPRVNNDWLVYRHQYVRQHNQPSFVEDDYAFNLGVSRRLNEANRLVISFDAESISPASAPFTLHVAFWNANGVVYAKHAIAKSGPNLVTYYEARSKPKPLPKRSPRQMTQSIAPVTREEPVSIRFSKIAAAVSLPKLSIERFVEYRLRDSDRDDLHQLKIGPGEVFVLGDNVPVSDDSRRWGPIPLNQIYGKIVRSYPPE